MKRTGCWCWCWFHRDRAGFCCWCWFQPLIDAKLDCDSRRSLNASSPYHRLVCAAPALKTTQAKHGPRYADGCGERTSEQPVSHGGRKRGPSAALKMVPSELSSPPASRRMCTPSAQKSPRLRLRALAQVRMYIQTRPPLKPKQPAVRITLCVRTVSCMLYGGVSNDCSPVDARWRSTPRSSSRSPSQT